ncbi:NAD(P)-dependent oxidoreductase [Alkalihalobacillus pseudalcaliphilus]|uniref:NAD(P)-dependent oxidoreductase n=1 Tax=Alkalihalobacillus pseudalcaliphilus TaxID=79884 RepID=UPI00064DAB05|nr:NAD(P)-dependent oxidoreductase [Alkalihalobacillus pseudalcaliphilus]KMK77073.1 3-hydroxyisobutyrate dehydrogenase [Alkalihalobacillus pseudalcaliphilus]
MQKVGYIGLGTMGFPMVQHLIKNGFDVYVLDGRGKYEEAVKLGAKTLSSPKEIAEKADIVMTCLPLPQTLTAVYEGENGLLAGGKKGTVFIDHSTADRNTVQNLSGLAKQQGSEFIDAPVSGGPMGAIAGNLTIMCGGSENTFSKAKAVMECYGEYIVLVGEVGSGTVVKLLNNMLIGVHQAALAECYIMAEKSGVDPSVAYDLIKRSSGFSKSMDWSVDAILDRKFEARFSLNLLHKDIGLALDLANEINMPLDMVKLGEQKVAEAKEKYGHEDICAVVKPLEEKTNISLQRK